jgi:hypothetical protein
MRRHKTLKITLSALAFLVLSSGVAYAASDQGFQRFVDLTDEQKTVLEEARTLRHNGDYASAQSLLKESGLALPKFKGHGFSKKMLGQNKEIREAIINDDYEAFSKLVQDSPVHISINEDTFNKIVEAHSLRVAGDYAGARKIMNGLGLRR